MNANLNHLATKLKLSRVEILVSAVSLWNFCVSLASIVLKRVGSCPLCQIREDVFGLMITVE
jgi:hypothetical protein